MMSPFPYEEPLESRVGADGATFPAPKPTEFMFAFFRDSEIVLALLAAILGAGLVSPETSRGTIFLLLSRPIERTRVLLTKYAVCALVLFAFASLVTVGLVVAESFRGWPVGRLSVSGLALSTVLAWLGSLFVLGMALVASVIFKDTVRSIPATLLAGYLMFNIPITTGDDGLNPLPQALVLPDFWHDPGLYLGEGFAPECFLICFLTAALPLLLALGLFRRKAY